MNIAKDAFSRILDLTKDYKHEIGGILGSREGDVISEITLDRPTGDAPHPCVYAPNTSFLNDQIAQWQEKNIHFKGLFHTHLAGSQELSPTDRNYIIAIMQAMPSEIDRLYFPVLVLPDRKLVSYIAAKRGKEIVITEETTTIV